MILKGEINRKLGWDQFIKKNNLTKIF
jgi:hypothetical protein